MATEKERRALLQSALRRLNPQVDPAGTFSENDFMHAQGKSSEALLYVSLFCPALVEVDGSVLLARAVESEDDIQRFLDYVQRKQGNRAAAESSFNLVEVPYLFSGRGTSDEDDELLAEYIADAWRGWLSTRYPGRRFVVEVVDADEAGSVVSISFSEDRSSVAVIEVASQHR